eukprot:gene17945-biopygen35358
MSIRAPRRARGVARGHGAEQDVGVGKGAGGTAAAPRKEYSDGLTTSSTLLLAFYVPLRLLRLHGPRLSLQRQRPQRGTCSAPLFCFGGRTRDQYSSALPQGAAR